MQSDRMILEAGHANLLSRLVEGLQMGWSNHPMMLVQVPTSTSSRLTDLAGIHIQQEQALPPPHPLDIQELVEERIKRAIAEGDERPVKISPLKVMIQFEHYRR